MVVYITLLVLLAFIGFVSCKNKNGNKHFVVFSFFLLTIISGFRSYSVGVDTELYSNFFIELQSVPFENLINVRYEYGFALFSKLLSLISGDYHVLLFVTSFFINFCVLRFIYKNSSNVVLSVLLYILCNFFFSYMNIMRQAISIGIVLLGYEYLKKDKYFVFSIFVLIASQFHFSAVLCFVFIIFKKYKFTRKFIMGLVLMLLLCFVFGDAVFNFLCNISPRFNAYVNSDYSKANFFGSFLEFLVVCFQFFVGMICITRYRKDIFELKSENLNTIIGVIGFVCMLSVLSMRATIFTRFVHYFSIFTVVWTPSCLNLIKTGKSRLASYVGITCLFIGYFLVIALYRSEWYGVIPYVFYD